MKSSISSDPSASWRCGSPCEAVTMMAFQRSGLACWRLGEVLSEGITTKGNCSVMCFLNSKSMISASWSSGSNKKLLSVAPRVWVVGK